MPTTDTDLQQLVINVGTKAQIEAAISGGTITADMLSITTDEDDYLKTSDVTSSYSPTGTSPVNGTAIASALSTLTIPTNIGSLSDVTITSATSGQALLYDGSKWVNGTVGTSLPSQTGHSGEFLTTDGTDASWGSVPSDSSKVDLDLDNMNPSATSKQTIVSWGVPDYSTSQSRSIGTTYTATEYGVVEAVIQTNNLSAAGFTFNGVETKFASTVANTRQIGSIYKVVRPGDTYLVSKVSGTGEINANLYQFTKFMGA